jgi:hypothetical protein
MKNETRKLKVKTISLHVKASYGDLEKDDYKHVGSFNLTVNLKNLSDVKSPEIEAIYLKTGNSWNLSISNTECPSNAAEDNKEIMRHFIAPPIKRLSPGAFAQTKIEFRKRFWSKFSGEEIGKSYTSKGNIEFEIVTSEGTFFETHSIDVKFEEFPF